MTLLEVGYAGVHPTGFDSGHLVECGPEHGSLMSYSIRITQIPANAVSRPMRLFRTSLNILWCRSTA